MYSLPFDNINKINEEIKSRIPILDYNSHLYASSINLLISGNYFEGYKKYKEFIKEIDCIDRELDLNIISFASCRMIHKKMYYEARIILEENIDKYPKELSLNNNLAVALLNLKEPQLALERFKLALDIDPDNREIRKNYDKIENYLSFQGKL